MLLLAVCCGTWAQTTYKLTQVNSVEADCKYVFVQGGNALTTVSSKAIQSTTSYSTSGLTGSETYIWTLSAGTNGFYMQMSNGNYLGNSSKTDMSSQTSKNNAAVWSFAAQSDGTFKITNPGNSDRFIGNNGSNAYKAYAAGHEDTYPWAINVYKLEEENGGETPSLQTNDLALTGNTNLSFDLYNNASAQTIRYTTSSTGAVTVSESDYVTTTVNNGTITVTPVKVTPSAQTITVYQAATDTYAAGSVAFTVSIADSTPFTGGDVTFVCGEDKSSGQSLTKNGVTMSFDSSNGGTWDRTDNYRLYSGQSMTISTATGKITSITFTISQNNFSGDGYNSETKTWTGNESSVTLEADGGQVRFTPVVVTVNTSGKQPAGLAYETTEYSVNLGETFNAPSLTNPNNLTVSYASSDQSVATVDAGTGAVTLHAAGTTTITATSTETEEYLAGSATYTLSVIDPNAPGTENNPYTVAQALGAATADNIYVQGIISTITEVSTEFGNATYKISDDGTTANEMIIYRGKYLNNEDFTSTDQIAVGDVVKVYGKLSNYQGANQMAQGNYIVTLQGSKPSPEMSFPEESYSATLGETFTAPALTITPNTLTVTYSSSDTSVATVNETSGEVTLVAAGETTITATFAGNDDYRSATASYNLTVTDPNAPDGTIDNPYRVQDVIDGTATGNVYVKGFIVGSYGSGSKTNFAREGLIASNLALADDPAETDVNNTIAVQMSSGSEIRTALNTQEKPYNIGVAQIIVEGNVESYITTKGIKSVSDFAKVAEQVVITSAGMSTYYTDCALDFTDNENIYAYTVTDGTNKVTYNKVDVVPANTAVVLRSVNEGAASELIPVSESTATANSALEGTLEDKYVTTGYVLNNGSNGVGFYKANPEANDGKGTKIAAHRAYLPATSGAKDFIGIDFESVATAISAIETETETNNVYDLQGRKVMNPAKGLYIVNGKKVVIK